MVAYSEIGRLQVKKRCLALGQHTLVFAPREFVFFVFTVLSSALFLSFSAGAETQPVQMNVDRLGRVKINGAFIANGVVLEAKLEALCRARPEPEISILPDPDAYRKMGQTISMLQKYGCKVGVFYGKTH